MLVADLIQVFLLLPLLFLSGFLSISETAFLTIDKLKVRAAAESGEPRARVLVKIFKNPDEMLGSILIGNNFVNIAAASISTALLVSWVGNEGIIYATFGMTVIIIVFCEILPKSYAVYNPEISYALSRPIHIMIRIVNPLARILTAFTGLVLKPFRGDKSMQPVLSMDEIRTIISLGEQDGVVDREGRRICHNVLEIRDLRVKEIMRPRTEMTALPTDASLEEVLKTYRHDQFSRMPVYAESLDNIVGILHAKDLLTYFERPQEFSLAALMRKPNFVPESQRLDELLKSFRQTHQHMAIVVDEYGGTEGLVTIEDILEEIVGEIYDEHDEQEGDLVSLPDGTYMIRGFVNIRDINHLLPIKLPEDQGRTMGGFLMNILGRIPENGEEINYPPFHFQIMDSGHHRIGLVKVTLKDKSDHN